MKNYCFVLFVAIVSLSSCTQESDDLQRFVLPTSYNFGIEIIADSEIQSQNLKPSLVQSIGGYRDDQILVFADSTLKNRMRIYKATSSVAKSKDFIQSTKRNPLQSVIFENDSTFFFVQMNEREEKLNYHFFLNKSINGIVFRFESDVFRQQDSLTAQKLFSIAQSAKAAQ